MVCAPLGHNNLIATVSNQLLQWKSTNILCVNRFMGWLLHKLLGRLLSAVIVHRGQMQMLQIACKVS